MARGRPAGSKNKKSGGGKKRSKAESFTGAKDGAAEMRKVDSPELDMSIEQRPGQFKSYYERAKSHYALYTKYQGLYRQVVKESKEAHPQLAEAVKLAIKLVQEDGSIDLDSIKEKLSVQGFVLKEFGATLQLTLHDTLLGDEKDLVFKRGYRNGKAGTAMECPYPEGSDLAAIYGDGYMKAQSEMIPGAQVQVDVPDDPQTEDEAQVDLAPPDHNVRNGVGVDEIENVSV